MEEALQVLYDCQGSFNHWTVVRHASELQLWHFLGVGQTPRVEKFLSAFPEGTGLAEILQTSLPEDASPATKNLLDEVNKLLIKNIRNWLPGTLLFQSVQECLSVKRPPKNILIDHRTRNAMTANPADEKEAERDGIADPDQEEEEKNTIERIREELRAENSSSQHGAKGSQVQWLKTNYLAFANEKVKGSLLKFQQLDKTDASRFDWLALENPWDLSLEHRAILVLLLWQSNVEVASLQFAAVKARYDLLCKDMDEIGKRRRVAVLQKAKIVGMTTTGAAMHQDVLQILAPAVIMVEEAAEILEPQLLAAMGADLQHLILIGDHLQLRPSVESYDLERWHGFGVSMFERLVEHNQLPFQALNLQCRMRKEFVPMLLPMYPTLRSHSILVSGPRNKAPDCMRSPMHFWSHTHEETTLRSYLNRGEADMVVALARWLVSEGQKAQDVTVLAAYNGQVTLIRKLLTEFPEMLEVKVHTIDRFQGAENLVVIVSLVRSNLEGRIGHLSMRNRLCVAVSRARSGVYICGSHLTLGEKSFHWRTLIEYFASEKCLDSSIWLCCPRHPNEPPYALCCLDAKVFLPSQVCKKPCRALLNCGHYCRSTCHSGDHSLCQEPVNFLFKKCGHSRTKLCVENGELFKCEIEISFTFELCGHVKQCKCWQKNGPPSVELKCEIPCGKVLPCGHACTLMCSEDCSGHQCRHCLEIEKEKAKIQKARAYKAMIEKRQELALEIQRLEMHGASGTLITELSPNNDTAKDYYMAKDRTERFIQPNHNLIPVVTKVEKIENAKLQKKFLEAQRDLISPVEASDWLFHGTDDNGVTGIVENGFRLPARSTSNMFGTGCYFATDSSKSAQNLYTKGSNKLLLCEVQLGKTWRVTKAKSDMDLTNIREKGYDSIFSVRDSRESGGTLFDEYVIYDPRQAIPRYIVHYKTVGLDGPQLRGFEVRAAIRAQQNGTNMSRTCLTPSLSFKGDNPEEYHFRMAESQFFRMSGNRQYKVTMVEFICNKALAEKYETKKKEYAAAKKPLEEQFVFHGTSADSVDKIAREGFKIGGEGVAMKCGAMYGRGVYTAVNPDISVAYSRNSNMMLLSLALPGKPEEDFSLGGGPAIFVIKNVDQLLPKYVVHYSK